ncbi:hypothetical protein EYF80_063170 [Liparis tanakae]|uniref:Uncharacterized protein n=1 Tax=Liparis tanakae TaxID=230148 RepID=A0A4Z2ED85_9TELE|nr:hypothetical protein EYF80_063170 [Liparis tanakae]
MPIKDKRRRSPRSAAQARRERAAGITYTLGSQFPGEKNSPETRQAPSAPPAPPLAKYSPASDSGSAPPRRLQVSFHMFNFRAAARRFPDSPTLVRGYLFLSPRKRRYELMKGAAALF